MAIKFVKSEVLENKALNYKFHLLRLKLKGSAKAFVFKPGQFILVKVAEKLFRAYSIASSPKTLPVWELLIDITPDGPGCRYLKNLRPGDTISTSTPKGVFFLEEDGSENIILGATGCGLASIKPIVEETLSDGKKMYLFWGLRKEEDIFDRNFLEDWKSKNPNFQYEIILSKPENGWQKTGHINSHMVEHIRNLPGNSTSVYLCGNSKMITDVKSLLKEIDFPEEKVYFERHY